VINSLAQKALYERRAIESVLLPNIFNFAVLPPKIKRLNSDLRKTLGIGQDQILVLQPTRVIPRKGIELAIEFVSRLNDQRQRLEGRESVLVVSHAAGDEGIEYLNQMERLASSMGVRFIYAAGHFAQERETQAGSKKYALWDAYLHADFVTYPSLIEGFGNALIETIYFRQPALVNRYAVYKADIAPLGFSFVEIEGAVPEQAVERTIELLIDQEYRQRTVDQNFHLATQHFSYEAMMPILEDLISPYEQDKR
jgi:glycosyltransferase involved in cell wall biosynthesis